LTPGLPRGLEVTNQYWRVGLGLGPPQADLTGEDGGAAHTLPTGVCGGVRRLAARVHGRCTGCVVPPRMSAEALPAPLASEGCWPMVGVCLSVSSLPHHTQVSGKWPPPMTHTFGSSRSIRRWRPSSRRCGGRRTHTRARAHIILAQCILDLTAQPAIHSEQLRCCIRGQVRARKPPSQGHEGGTAQCGGAPPPARTPDDLPVEVPERGHVCMSCVHCKLVLRDGGSNDIATGASLLRCAQCEDAVYCSRACQHEHWPVHRASCAR
jgi:hypothetical protein